MIIKPYSGLPRTYAPDVGEIVEARRTGGDKFVEAVVMSVRRNRDGHLRIRIQWLGDDPNAGVRDRLQAVKSPVVALTYGWLVHNPGSDAPPLIRQISRGAAS